MLDYTKNNVPLSIKSKSVICWESLIHCFSPLRYYSADVFKALKKLKSNCLKQNDGKTVSNVGALILSVELNYFAEKAGRKTL